MIGSPSDQVAPGLMTYFTVCGSSLTFSALTIRLSSSTGSPSGSTRNTRGAMTPAMSSTEYVAPWELSTFQFEMG